MKIKTKVRAGTLSMNRNGVAKSKKRGIKIKSKVRAGAITHNRNAIVR
jgi:hypothetical protein